MEIGFPPTVAIELPSPPDEPHPLKTMRAASARHGKIGLVNFVFSS